VVGQLHASINHSLIKGQAAGWTTGIRFLAEIFLFTAISRPVLGQPSAYPIDTWRSFPWVKWLGLETVQSAYTTEFKNALNFISVPCVLIEWYFSKCLHIYLHLITKDKYF
jgi:hypothetical protein